MVFNRLKEFRCNRNDKGISQGQLANMLNVSKSYISKLENNQREPSAEIMFRIVEKFQCKVDDMFYRKDEK